MHGMRALALAVALGAGGANAEEVTVRNDSLTDFSTAVVVTGFIAGGGAGSWLTSPCTGAVRAVQVFWRSQSGTTGQIIHNRIDILRGGVFPVPGVPAYPWPVGPGMLQVWSSRRDCSHCQPT